MNKHIFTLAAVVLAGVAIVALSATASGGDRAAAAVKFACPDFRVVHDDIDAGFRAGLYHRRNFSEPKDALTCDDSYHVLRSYLYHPESHKGWTVSKLKGDLSKRTGRRFVKNGTDSQIGFDVFR